MHWINEILDRMIQENPAKRFTDAGAVSDAVDVIIKKILVNAHPLDLNAPQACLYCGTGFYKKFVDINQNDGAASDRLTNSGFRFIPVHHWLILVCDNCGNSQIFIRNFPGTSNWKSD